MNHCAFFQDDLIDETFPFALVRNVSDDNLFANFFTNISEPNEPQPSSKPEFVLKNELVTLEQQPLIPNFCEYRTERKKKDCHSENQRRDYKKNICGYITKKIVREFMSQTYKQKVKKLCRKYKCNYDDIVDFYDKKIQRITGPTHLDMLLNGSKEQSNMKKCFKQFFIWFLRHRYLRYLLSQGKMDKKEAYIDYKNNTLLYLGSIQENYECNSSIFGEFQSRQTVSIN